MKPASEYQKANLVDAIQAANTTAEDLRLTWRLSKFEELLGRNLLSAKPIVPAPSSEWPRVRCYRGTGPRVAIAHAHVRDNGIVSLAIDTDFKPADLDSASESEGCPGAPVKSVRFYLEVPAELLANPTKGLFAAWASIETFRLAQEKRAEAIKTIKELCKENGLIIQAPLEAA